MLYILCKLYIFVFLHKEKCVLFLTIVFPSTLVPCGIWNQHPRLLIQCSYKYIDIDIDIDIIFVVVFLSDNLIVKEYVVWIYTATKLGTVWLHSQSRAQSQRVNMIRRKEKKEFTKKAKIKFGEGRKEKREERSWSWNESVS